MNAHFINIGASSDTILSARGAILAILENTNTENQTKVQALIALTNVCQVEDVMIRDSHFVNNAAKPEDVPGGSAGGSAGGPAEFDEFNHLDADNAD